MKIVKKNICVYLLLLYCSYRALIKCILFDLQPLVLILVCVFGILRFIKCRIYKEIDETFILLLGSFWIYIVLNGMFLFNADTFIKGLTQYILFMMPMFACWNLIDINSFDSYARFIIVVNIPNMLGGIYEGITGKYILSTSHVQYNLDGKIRTAAFTGDMIALPMILGMCVILCMYLRSKSKGKKYVILGLLDLISILLTQSRGPLVATIIGMVFFFILTSNNTSSSLFKSKKVLLRVISMCFVLMLLYFVIIKTSLLDSTPLAHFAWRMRTIFTWTNSENDHSNATRILIWMKWIDEFKARPLFGAGIGITGSDSLVTKGPTESAVLKRLVELGIVGTVLSFGMLSRIIVCSIKKIRDCTTSRTANRNVYISVFSCVILIFIEGMVLQVDEYFIATTYMWSFLSVVLSKSNRRSSKVYG